MRTQWTAKGNRDAGSSCSCVRGLHRYLRNFGGGGLNTPNHPPRYATADSCGDRKHAFSFSYKHTRYGFLQPSNNSTIRNVRLWPSCQSTRTKQCVDDSGRCSFSCAPRQGQEDSLSVQRNASEPCLVTGGQEMCPNMRTCACVRI